jgi:iron complex transport system ATP-binding protein
VLLHRGRVARIGDRRTAVTLERIRELFEVDVAIRHTDDGVPSLLPQTMQPAPRATR